jgi:hypothetical protein
MSKSEPFREKRGVFRMPYSKGEPAVAGVASIVQRGSRTFLEIWPGFRVLSATAAPLCFFLMRGDMLTGSFFRVSACETQLLLLAEALAATPPLKGVFC